VRAHVPARRTLMLVLSMLYICSVLPPLVALQPPPLHFRVKSLSRVSGAKLLVASSPGNRTHKAAAQVAAAVLLGVMKSSSII
jgi:hypothetical protein